MNSRIFEIQRKTNETDITSIINVDGVGISDITTGIGFFDHMLIQIAKHGFFDINIKAKGDTCIDSHHTIEDVGIVFGKCISKALGNKEGIKRYGSKIIPMDETLVLCSLDISGRPYLNFDAQFSVDKLGEFDTEMVEEFFRAVAYNCGMNLHIKVLDGKNNHHIVEGIFKAFGRALDEATEVDLRIRGVLSSKGMLEV